jgi:L-2-hydroxyglutarate oxidase LhgO
MREFAKEHNIECKSFGKVIIATSEKDLPIIDSLLQNSINNNINVKKLDEKGVREIEPYASPFRSGIYSPDTAVIDSKAVVFKLKFLLESEGVKFFFNSRIKEVSLKNRSIKTYNNNFSYGYVYNCAGAGADLVAKKFGHAENYSLVPFKGIYYKLKKSKTYMVKGNIYPVPDIEQPFLGVHLTRVISGDVYIGPTAIPAFGRENYGIFSGIEFLEGLRISKNIISMYYENKQHFRKLVHTEIKKYLKPWFVESAKKLVKTLQPDDLELSDKVGIRPQLINLKTRSLEMDYILQNDESSMHVLNSISPAFTSSFAFAEWIVDLAESS